MSADLLLVCEWDAWEDPGIEVWSPLRRQNRRTASGGQGAWSVLAGSEWANSCSIYRQRQVRSKEHEGWCWILNTYACVLISPTSSDYYQPQWTIRWANSLTRRSQIKSAPAGLFLSRILNPCRCSNLLCWSVALFPFWIFTLIKLMSWTVYYSRSSSI